MYLNVVVKSLTAIRTLIVFAFSVLISWLLVFSSDVFEVLTVWFIVFSVLFFNTELNFLIGEKAVKSKGISWRLYFVSYLVTTFILILLLFLIFKQAGWFANQFLTKGINNIGVISMVFLGIGFFLSSYVVYQKKTWVQQGLIDEKQEFLTHSLNALKSQNVIVFLKDALENTHELIETDSPKAVVQLEKLTTILRHLLQSRNEKFVDLGTELKVVKEYCELAEIHIGKQIELAIQVDKGFNNTKVPPLVFQMILDHQFQFFEKDQSKNIEIEVYVENKNFVVVKTSLPSDSLVTEQTNDRFISNLKERYKLYSNAADVSILSTSTNHFVKVPLLAG